MVKIVNIESWLKMEGRKNDMEVERKVAYNN